MIRPWLIPDLGPPLVRQRADDGTIIYAVEPCAGCDRPLQIEDLAAGEVLCSECREEDGEDE